MVKCSFSGKDIPPGTGLMFVRKDGKIFYFKDRKSLKNMLKLGRKPHAVKWTTFYKKGTTGTTHA